MWVLFLVSEKMESAYIKKLLEKSMKNMSLKTNPILSSRESILYWVPEPDKSNGATLFLEVDLMEA